MFSKAIVALFICATLLVQSQPRAFSKTLSRAESLRSGHNHTRTQCLLPRLTIELFALLLPVSYHDHSHTLPGDTRPVSCEQWYAFQLLRRCMSEANARRYAIQKILGTGLNAATIGLLLDGRPGPVLKVVILDSSSEHLYIPAALTSGPVRSKKFFEEFEKHNILYSKYRQLALDAPEAFAALPFEIFDVYNLTNYTVIRKASGRTKRPGEERVDVAFYLAERIPAYYSSYSWLTMMTRAKGPDRAYLDLLFDSMVKLFNTFGFVHGDLHMGNVHYDNKSKKLAIFDFDRGIFLSQYSKYIQRALFLRDYFTPLAFLMAYYETIEIKDKVSIANAYCDLAETHMKEIPILKEALKSQREELDGYQKTYLKRIPSINDYAKSKIIKDNVYEKLDNKFWKFSINSR